jgi:hypothetical protein
MVSIVITNYNYGRFLSRCIDSALAQTHSKTEVVVVDDASSDDSREVIRSYSDRVITVLLADNSGQGAAFNAGFGACHGDVVLFLDADDWLYPDAAARVSGAVAPGVAQVQFRLHITDGEGSRLGLLPAREVAFDDGDVVPLLLASGRYENTVTSGNAFARSTLSAILPVPEMEYRISADGYLVTVAPLCGWVVSIDEPLGVYTLHGGNNWSGPTAAGLGEWFRRSVQHDSQRYDTLRHQAAERGLVVSEDPGLRDVQHLSHRIGLLVFDPGDQAVRSDSRIAMAARGAWASRSARLPAARRFLLAAWFLALGILPRRLAVRPISWRMVPATRPRLLRWAMKRVRPWLR